MGFAAYFLLDSLIMVVNLRIDKYFRSKNRSIRESSPYTFPNIAIRSFGNAKKPVKDLCFLRAVHLFKLKSDIHTDGPANSAAFDGDIDTLKSLLKAHGRRSVAFAPRGPYSWNALMVASFAGQVDTVRFLIDEVGFCVEERDACLRTPIHLATKSGSICVVRLLLERGADPDHMDEAQRTALIYAAAAYNVPLLSCLLDGNADPDVTDQSLRSCLHYLAEGGYSHCGGGRGGMCGRVGHELAVEKGVKRLLLYGAQVDIGDHAGHTPLHLAAASSKVNVVSLLLGLGGANPSVEDKGGMTPLRLAKSKTVEEMLEAAPYQAYQLEKMRCLVELMGTENKEDGQYGKLGGALTDDAHARESEDRATTAPSLIYTNGKIARPAKAVERVRHLISLRRQTLEPPRPMPRVHFHGRGEDGPQRPVHPIPDLPVCVLQLAVQHMNGDLFKELLGFLWSWRLPG